MAQEESSELSYEDYLERLNGKVEGLSLAFHIYVATLQSREKLESYIESLVYAENSIKKKIESSELKFRSREYPESTLMMLRELIDFLGNLTEAKEE